MIVTILLLIGLMTSAILIFSFGTSFFTELQSEHGGSLEKTCLSNVKVRILDACYYTQGESIIITATLQNQGNYIITQNSIFKINGQDNCLSVAPPFSDLPQFETETFEFSTECINLNTLEFIPSIELNGANELCEVSSTTHELTVC